MKIFADKMFPSGFNFCFIYSCLILEVYLNPFYHWLHCCNGLFRWIDMSSYLRWRLSKISPSIRYILFSYSSIVISIIFAIVELAWSLVHKLFYVAWVTIGKRRNIDFQYNIFLHSCIVFVLVKQKCLLSKY